MLFTNYNIKAQTNLINNPSFEWRQRVYNIPLLPVFYSYYCYPGMGVEYYDEVTRCLGDYNYNLPSIGECFYPNPADRNKTKASGGCDGWYNPLDGNFSTPDYLNRNVSGDRARYVDVPNNYYNNFGVGVNHRQEPFDDDNDNEVDEGEEDAYIGIWNVRCLNNPSNNYAEYVTQRFSDGNHLKAYKKYLIRFRVSWTYGIVDNNETGQTEHYLKGIGAYFSVTDPFEYRRQNYRPLDLKDNTEGLVYNADYNSPNSATYYNNTGGEDGKHWDVVENYYQPTENKYFITIGNFKNIWVENVDFKGPGIPADSYINIYYFIDAVEVIEVDFSCTCESVAAASVYDISLVPKLKDPNSNECCFDVFLTVAKLLNTYDLCYVNRAKIYEVVDEPYEEKYKGIFELGQGYFHQKNNVKIFENLCFSDSESTPKKLKVYLYQGYASKCTIIKQFVVSCPCGCEPDPSPPNKVNITKINYSQNSGKTSCCWDLAISNESDCNFSLKEIFAEFDDAQFDNIHIDLNSGWGAELLNRENGKSKYKFTNQGLILLPTEAGQPIKFGKMCVDWNTPPTQIKFTYSTEEGLCNREINLDFKCEDCCGKIHTTINAVPYYDDATRCCFFLHVNIDPGFLCGVDKVRIFPLDNDLYLLWDSKENNQYLHVGSNLLKFCVSEEVFNNNPTLSIKIKYLLENSEPLCEANGIINKCMLAPLPCDPEQLQNPIWMPEKTKTISFDCPPNNTPCSIKFTYTYRHVKIGNIADHRDVQVLKWNPNPSCNCEDEYYKQMLIAIWNDPQVILNFELDDQDWENGGERCFTNFRVITSDCWQQSETFPNNYFRKCDGYACCYAVYEVCYKKINDVICLKPNSTNPRISQSEIIPYPCLAPCDTRGCHNWRPADGHVSGRISVDDYEIKLYQSNCDVYLNHGNKFDKHNLMINCGLNGNIKVVITDVIGNIISNNTVLKNNYSISIPIDDKISSGLYFVIVLIDNVFIHSDRIMIVK